MDIAFLFFFFLKDKWLGDGEGWEGKLCDASWQAELSWLWEVMQCDAKPEDNSRS